MNFTRSLRSRIVFAFVGFGLILSVTLAVALFFGFHTIEDFVVDDAMRSELTRALSGTEISPLGHSPSALIEIYAASAGRPGTIPAHLRTLEPGEHRVTNGGRQYKVLVEDHARQRYIVSYDETQIMQREQLWLIGLAGGVVAALFASLWAGYTLSGRVIRPVVELTGEVQALKTGQPRGHRLTDYAQDEVGILAGVFRNYHDQIRSLMDREREFVSNVSHELRTPVTSINLAVEVLAGDPTMTEKQRFRLERIRRAGREMSEMINTFLLLSRHEDDEEAAECHVNPIVRQVVEDQAVWIGAKPLSTQLTEEAELTVHAPPGVVSVLIGNVVRNAYRYTKTGLVTIRITDDRVSVEDTGPGIDPETEAHIFERHVHGDATDHGTGLGLAIVKRLCERYHWRVDVTSTVGRGSRFDLILRPASDSGVAT